RLHRDRPELTVALESLIGRVQDAQKPGVRLTELRDRLSAAIDHLTTPDVENDQRALELLKDALLTQSGPDCKPKIQGLNSIQDELGPFQEIWCPLLLHVDFDF